MRMQRILPAVLILASMTTLTPHLAFADPVEPNRDGYSPHEILMARLPYIDELAPRVDTLPHDDTGVRMFQRDGTLYDHPVAQAQWGLLNYSSYLDTGDEFFLDRAIANAQRNLDRKVEARGAWWFPYTFDAPRCPERPVMEATWYSAMAQGQLLSLFVRLYEATIDERWRIAADQTFASLLLPPAAGEPWGTWTDADSYLWLEEYPDPAGVDGERVMNGHIFAIYGVYDYWRLTGATQAAELFDAAATTVRRYMPDPIRLQNWASRYSFGCLNSHTGYHVVHTNQSLHLYEMTHASVFAKYASMLRGDYPDGEVDGTVRFSAGEHTGYTFDIDGNITGSIVRTLPAASNAHADRRVRIKGRGIYYRITNGIWDGYYVPETFGRRTLLGVAVEQKLDPIRTLIFQPRTYTAYRYDAAGTVTASKVATFTNPSAAPAGSTAYVNGRFCYYITAGAFASYWLPHTTGLAFAS